MSISIRTEKIITSILAHSFPENNEIDAIRKRIPNNKIKIPKIGMGPRNNDPIKSVVFPVKHKVNVPIIEKKNAQVLSVANNEAQLMDSETYETFVLPLEPDQIDKVKPGTEVSYWEAMGTRRIMLQN